MLIVHTLATNSAKYGALSLDGGAVRVSWETTDDNLSLDWQENGGPKVGLPTKKGFGTALVKNTISGQVGTLDYTCFPRG